MDLPIMWRMHFLSCFNPCNAIEWYVRGLLHHRWRKMKVREPTAFAFCAVGNNRTEICTQTVCFNLLSGHRSQHLLSVVINPGSFKTITTCSPPSPLSPLRNSDSVGLEWDSGICIFKKHLSPLYSLRAFCCVSGSRKATAFHTSLSPNRKCFLPASDPLSSHVSILLTAISINISNARLSTSQILGYFKTLPWRQASKIKYTSFLVASKCSQCLSSSKKIFVFVFLASKASQFHKPRLLLIKGNSRSLVQLSCA